MNPLTAASDAVRKVLSVYFDNVENLEINLWDGIVRLRDLTLKPAALAALPLDVPVGLANASGSIGEVLLEVPWRKSLLNAPVSVTVNRVEFVLRGITTPPTNPFDAAAAARQGTWKRLNAAHRQPRQ
jgi:hypothetical protein